MATIRGGNQPILLVVDVQVGVVADAWEADRAVSSIAFAVERARSAGVPVVPSVSNIFGGLHRIRAPDLALRGGI